MKNEHIETIRRQFGVALATIYRYNNEHKSDIERISNIFYLHGDSKKKVLVLLYMLSLGENDDAVQRYREEMKLNSTEYDPENLLNQNKDYKDLLLTAMIYNPVFYAMAVNFRGFVNAGFSVGEVEENSIDLAMVKKWYNHIEELVVPSKPEFEESFDVRFRPRKFDRLAASPDVDSDEESIVYRCSIDDILGKYCGELILIEDERDQQRLEARFQFLDKETKEIIDTVPGYFKIELILNDDDKSKHIISLDREMTTKQATIRSRAIYNIDLSKGFTVNPTNIKDTS